MARHVEGPWFRTSKNTWYATLRGCDRHGEPRLVFLPPSRCDRLRKEDRVEGPLQRTVPGDGWSGRSVTRSMRKGGKRAEGRAIPSGYRHGYATEALSRGVRS